MALIDALGPGPVAVDTAPFIYLIERHHDYLPLVRPMFEAADADSLELVTSGLTLLEVLVVPLRDGRQGLAQRYEAILTRSRGVRMVELGLPVLKTAAMLRARHGVATPDALQLAAGLLSGCRVFVTNDRRLPPDIPGLRIVQLSEHLPSRGL